MIVGGIEYFEAGEGPAVVFLHGIGGEAELFGPHLELPGFRGVAWNMPGYGQSETGAWPPSFASLSLSLAGFVGALGADRVHLVGHSIGGMLALEHAVRRPEQVASLTLIGTTPAFGGPDESFKRDFLEARLGPLDAGQTMEEMAEHAAPGLVGPEAEPGCVSDIARAMGRVPEATWRGILECLVTFNRRDDLGAVEVPVCLIAGSEDRNAPARTMARMAEKMSGAEYHELEGIGHMIAQEAPGQVAEILRDFLRRRG
ncbi:alpha/beta hydrolase [Psychromarinibacter sp. C21-152]|uniref:Alpha/beta hydrolase n=1 Tax=Psychromarinibacter sediminicola TaxID=3033385 RepID=A0AAE3TA20_9RHOB|nr:alpha/beta hydrolase [Psychromarinibacter sediminicola]MDF0601554.1 alpha/beta hydrolase [Psychromarinibacter sediminicola]